VKHEGWVDAAASVGVDLPPEAPAQLDRFAALLRAEALPRGMVSKGDASALEERHLLDSLRAASVMRSTDDRAYDLGSGAGLPGIPIAIAVPGLSLTLVEVRETRARFLDASIRRLELERVGLYRRRAETIRDAVPLCFARAFAPPSKAWTVAERILEPGGRLVYWAGHRFDPVEDKPPGVRVDLFQPGALARWGPLAIMSRQ
jgi:16S rRNA (guanine527-N7)-methyltransferase